MTAPLDATALVPSESGAAEQSRRELQAKLAGIGGLGGRKMTPEAREKKLREACEGFESVFIQKMWQEMRNTIPKGGLMHGKEERFWQDMYDQELSKSMTSAGGIGLADMMYAQLSRNLVSASRSAAGVNQGRAFAPGAAPLMPPQAAAAAEGTGDGAASGAEHASVAAAKPRAAIYDGAAPGVAGAREEAAASPASAAPAVPGAAPRGQAAASHGEAGVSGAAARGAADPGDAVELNPEVERALAALRARQALHHRQEEGAPATQQAATATTQPQAVAAGRAQRQRPMASSGIELAQVARREAGDKLGSGAVRPPLHQPSPRHAADAAQPQQAQSPLGEESAQAAAAAENAPAAARPRTVRYSTNMRPQERARRGLKPIRVLNVDNVGVNSKAGAGLAAYHASRDAQAAADAAAAAPTQGMQSGQGMQPGQGAQAPRSGQPAQGREASPPAGADDSGNFSIPPLTAADARG